MDINRFQFSDLLPTVLKRIAESDLVSFDLELSGIPAQRRRDVAGKASLQERYEDIKNSANKYHILQFGLTCVQEDRDVGKYYMYPFNFSISPLIRDDLGLDRDYTFSSSAAQFLRNTGFPMDEPFSAGVPYLTKAETETIRQTISAKWDKSAIPDIKIKDDDTDAKEFMARVRREVSQWKTTHQSDREFYNILGLPVDASHGFQPLNRFQKRLVHQVVRSDFPDLQTSGGAEFVQVQYKDEVERAKVQKDIQARISGDISSQIGFRWVTEALVGGDLSDVRAAITSRQIFGERAYHNNDVFERRLEILKTALSERPKVFVGHNCFLDFIYLHKFMIGELPDCVEDFQATIHEYFPLVFDTKFMSTAGSDPRFRGAQLWQLDEAFSDQETPKIDVYGHNRNYAESKNYHEAGFDSFVTARAFLKLATRIEANPDSLAPMKKENQAPQKPTSILPETSQAGVETAAAPLPEQSVNAEAKARGRSRSKVKRDRYGAANAKDQMKARATNIYEALQGRSEEDDERSSLPVYAENPVSSSNTEKPKGSSLEKVTQQLSLQSKTPEDLASLKPLIPEWDSPFWKTYADKLRVFGTVEEVCHLTSGKAAEKEDTSSTDSDGNAEFSRPPSPSIWTSLSKYIFKN